MDNLQKYAIDITKDIVISKLSSASPNYTNADSGKAIGEMFEAIYNEVYKVCTNNSK